MADAPVHVVHLSSAAALDEVRRAKAAGVRVERGDLPALPGPHRRAIRRPRPGPVRPLRDRAAAPVRGRPRRAVGRPGRRLARPRRDRPRPGSARPSRRPRRRAACPFNEISNGAPGIETLLTILYSEGVASGRHHARADGRPPRHDARAPVRPRQRRAPSRSVATPTSSCSTPPPAGRSAPTDLHHTSDYTPYEGIEVAGPCGTCSSAAETSSWPARSSAGAGPVLHRARLPTDRRRTAPGACAEFSSSTFDRYTGKWLIGTVSSSCPGHEVTVRDRT